MLRSLRGTALKVTVHERRSDAFQVVGAGGPSAKFKRSEKILHLQTYVSLLFYIFDCLNSCFLEPSIRESIPHLSGR
eukprot:6469936-Amphidinium_carterae.1